MINNYTIETMMNNQFVHSFTFNPCSLQPLVGYWVAITREDSNGTLGIVETN